MFIQRGLSRNSELHLRTNGRGPRALRRAEVFYVLCSGFKRVLVLDFPWSQHAAAGCLNANRVPTVPGSSVYQTADRT